MNSLNKLVLNKKLHSKKIFKMVAYGISLGAITIASSFFIHTNNITQKFIADNSTVYVDNSIPFFAATGPDTETRVLNLENTFSFTERSYDENTISTIEGLTEEEFFSAVLQERTIEDIVEELSLEETSIVGKTTLPAYYEPDKPKVKERKTKTIQIPVYTPEQIAANALTPYLAPVDTNDRTYNYGNMVDGEAAGDISSLLTENDLEYLARIIHCESCSGYDARRAVGTVIVNRLVSTKFKQNTVLGVISAPSQFSPYASGKFWSCTPCEADYEAAYDVLYNGYRSFPKYVCYFQSIYDGYFRNQRTYVTYKIGNSYHYFSYNPKDV